MSAPERVPEPSFDDPDFCITLLKEAAALDDDESYFEIEEMIEKEVDDPELVDLLCEEAQRQLDEEVTATADSGSSEAGKGAYSRLPSTKANHLIKVLERAGYKKRPGKGSHMHLINQETGQRTRIGSHSNQQLGHGLLSTMLEQAGMSQEEFRKRS
jgi:predicted RNA binding protein YcfA (HicA-like mRNA interferase family)